MGKYRVTVEIVARNIEVIEVEAPDRSSAIHEAEKLAMFEGPQDWNAFIEGIDVFGAEAQCSSPVEEEAA